MPPSLGPVLVLFLQGFIAMEIAYHLGPRNFRSSAESYKYVVALLMGSVVFAITNRGSHWQVGLDSVSDPKKLTAGVLFATLGNAILVGLLWHVWFSYVVPYVYRRVRWVRQKIWRKPLPHFHGPIRVFDRAMDLMDGLDVQVFLKDGRVLCGGIKAYPDLDGDSGLVLQVVQFGVIPDKGTWEVKWLGTVSDKLESLMWIPHSMIEYLNAVAELVPAKTTAPSQATQGSSSATAPSPPGLTQ